MDRIITARDYCKRDGDKSYKERIKRIYGLMQQSRGAYDTPPKLEDKPKGKPVYAEIDWGRWIVKCPDCNGAEDVDPDEPVFYCLTCGNYKNNGYLRPVIFPSKAEREEIEKVLLERPVEEKAAPNELERIVGAKPKKAITKNGIAVRLSRNWKPNETAADLRRENKAAK